MDRTKHAIRRIIEFRLAPDAKERAMQDTTWADGLRGIAAVMVVCSHLTLCYARNIIPPCCAPESTSPRLFQRPIFRLVASGHSWVAIFFILMGFVNSLKPIQLARAGQSERALSKLASSSFTRIFRLVLPASTATVLSWVICNFGFYQRSLASDAFWLRNSTPQMSATWLQAGRDLLSGLKYTWVFGAENPYDQPQWALVYLLQGSIMTISALFLTVSMTPLWRSSVLVILTAWSMNWSAIIGDPWTGLCCFMGIVLGEISLSSIPKAAVRVSPYLSTLLILCALVLMSYPGSFAEAATWSKWLHEFGTRYFPLDATGGLDRLYGSLGGLLLVLGIIISPHVRWALGCKALKWLGKVSFAIYLLHGMVMRSVFAWILHLGYPLTAFVDQNADGAEYRVHRYPVGGFVQSGLATVLLVIIVGAASHAWTLKLEPVFAKITSKVESLVNGNITIEVKTSDKATLLPIRND